MRARADRLIEGAIDAGLLDLANAAIRALDALEGDRDREPEEDGETSRRCRACSSR